MTNAKKGSFDDRLNCFKHSIHLISTDVMSLVRSSFEKGFSRVENNFKAISFCGWDPFTMALLLDPILYATTDMINQEIELSLFPSWALEGKHGRCYVEYERSDVSYK